MSLAGNLVSPNYIRQGAQSLQQRKHLMKVLLSQRRLPEQGWDDQSLEILLHELAAMDSNNFPGAVGMGEREARCASRLVWRRHYGLAHGIGRSGSLTDEQPKAAGSTLIARLTNALAADALRLAGLLDIGAVTVLPVATGMALMLALSALMALRPPQAKFVVWPRVDQQTCLKAVLAAGLQLLVVPNALEGDELRTDVAALERAIERVGGDHVLCVLSTTSCFAARGADRVEDIAKLCARVGVGHVINNAYGVQAADICSAITRAWRRGRVDAVVQSTDKNFLVPVGGAVVAAGSKDPSLVHAVNSLYPGRASITPLLDVFITLLSLGASGWKSLLARREGVYRHLHKGLSELASRHGERVLHTPSNPISLAMTLPSARQVARAPAQAAMAPEAFPARGGGGGGGEADVPAGAPLSAAERPLPVGDGGPRTLPMATGGDGDSAQGTSSQSARLTGVALSPALREPLPGGGEAGGAEAPPGERDCPPTPSSEPPPGGAAGRQEGGPEPPTAVASTTAHEAAAEGPAPPPGRAGGDAPAAAQELTFLGSMLFSRYVSGCRVIVQGKVKVVGGVELRGWGASSCGYPYPYLTVAAAIGATEEDVNKFLGRLDKCLVTMSDGKGKKAP